MPTAAGLRIDGATHADRGRGQVIAARGVKNLPNARHFLLVSVSDKRFEQAR